jgi:hypothetical protein
MAPPPAKKVKTDTATTTTAQISGDSLDQDFLLEDNFAPSDDSGDEAAGGQDFDPAELVASDDEASSHPHRPLPQSDDEPAPKKRKAADNSEGASSGAEGATGEGKKKKQKKDKKPIKPKAAKLQELGIGESEGLGLLPLPALVDALAEKQKRALPKLSNMEMDDLKLPGESLLLFKLVSTFAEADPFAERWIRILPRRHFFHHRTHQSSSLPPSRFPHPSQHPCQSPKEGRLAPNPGHRRRCSPSSRSVSVSRLCSSLIFPVELTSPLR